MDDPEVERLRRSARDHRARAALAREEAAARGASWWGHNMLRQSAEYYDRRARDADRQLQNLTAPRPPGDAADRDKP